MQFKGELSSVRVHLLQPVCACYINRYATEALYCSEYEPFGGQTFWFTFYKWKLVTPGSWRQSYGGYASVNVWQCRTSRCTLHDFFTLVLVAKEEHNDKEPSHFHSTLWPILQLLYRSDTDVNNTSTDVSCNTGQVLLNTYTPSRQLRSSPDRCILRIPSVNFESFHPYRQDPWCVVFFIPPLSTGPVMCRVLYSTPVDRTRDVSLARFPFN